jgi:hypothetical protein
LRGAERIFSWIITPPVFINIYYIFINNFKFWSQILKFTFCYRPAPYIRADYTVLLVPDINQSIKCLVVGELEYNMLSPDFLSFHEDGENWEPTVN